ncbi:MAG: HAD family hydrolase [Clostridiales bacterium]|nr:HAD family hydrolase [Candidatus Equinaster intestinalis]
MIEAVIFDLDGTLVNSLLDLANASNFALSFYGFPTHETEKYKYFVGNGIPKLIYRITPKDKRDEATLNKISEKFFENYNVHYADNTYVYSGIKELIAKLKETGIKTAVVTNKAHAAAIEVINSLLPDTFDLVLGQRPEIPTKPDPTLTLMAMEKLEVKPDECIFMGDSGMDVKTGVNSGALPVGVLWGYRKEDELLENGAKYIIENPGELIKIINEN